MSLKKISYLYVTTPLLIFFIFWLKPVFGVPAILLTILGLYFVFKKEPTEENAGYYPQKLSSLILNPALAAMVSLLWCLFSGAGGVGFQNGDYIKHNSMLADLIRMDWPVVYNQPEGPMPLIYYFAYYLPAALAGKIFGFKAAAITQFLWCWFGVFLSIMWFQTLVNYRKYLAPFVFILFGGLDVAGVLLWLNGPFRFGDHIEWWAGFAQYSSNTTLLYWVPQHAISGWVFTGILIDDVVNKKTLKNICFLFPSAILWSMFVAVGLAGLSVFAVIDLKFKKLFSINNIFVSIVPLTLVVLFFLSKSQDQILHHWMISSFSALKQYAVFCVIEFLIFAVFIFAVNYRFIRGAWMFLFAATILSLAAIPSYKIGVYNDFCMRVSIPALFALWIFCYNAVFSPFILHNRFRNFILKPFLLAFILIGSIAGISEFKRACTDTRISLRPTESQGVLIVDLAGFMPQYVGRTDSLFFRYFIR